VGGFFKSVDRCCSMLQVHVILRLRLRFRVRIMRMRTSLNANENYLLCIKPENPIADSGFGVWAAYLLLLCAASLGFQY
jgi:hypothetical protein